MAAGAIGAVEAFRHLACVRCGNVALVFFFFISRSEHALGRVWEVARRVHA